TTIILYGVLQGRFDHTMANLYLLLHRDPSLILMDAHNRVRVLLPGSYTVAKQYAYLSFLALEESSISESGVAYPLDHAHIDVTDIFTVSNEIVEEEAQITVHEGRVLMIEADDRP
ncbi:MAG: thiamine diphosphokinase, partial [Merdibacter sp.]